MKTIDPKPYDQATRDTAVKLFMELMAFSAAADYSRVAVLKIGDRIDDHVYTYNGQSASSTTSRTGKSPTRSTSTTTSIA